MYLDLKTIPNLIQDLHLSCSFEGWFVSDVIAMGGFTSIHFISGNDKTTATDFLSQGFILRIGSD